MGTDLKPLVAGRVDCVVRFHDPSRVIELRRCLFSLYGQHHRPLHVHVVTQRFSAQQLREVEDLLDPLRLLPDAPVYSVANFDRREPADAQSELLSLGIALSNGQYIAFLDYDDTLYPEAYAVLVERLCASGAAIAFASVRALDADIHTEGGFVQPTGVRDADFNRPGRKDIIAGDFRPLHSYLIDRSRVKREIVRFDPTFMLEEDYDLLLRICMASHSDFALLSTCIGDHMFESDGSNVGFDAGGPGTKTQAWVRAQMQARRALESLGHQS